MPDIVIVASAFGADAVRRAGHAAFVTPVADAGASGFEVRRELFADDTHAAPAALKALGAQIAARGLWSVYSTPDNLFDKDGAPDHVALSRALAEGASLGARIVKLQLGGFDATTGARQKLDSLIAQLRDAPLRVVVENGQLQAGGLIAQFASLFDALREAGAGERLGMTFDVGNWRWPGEAPLDAARRLASHVEYIHCKAVTGEGARRFAIAPDAGDPTLAAVLPLLPPDVPRGIEYPLAVDDRGHDLQANAARHVAWLAAA